MKQEEYLALIQTIEYHNELYYNQDLPQISDYEYDKLFSRLKYLEKNSIIFFIIGKDSAEPELKKYFLLNIFSTQVHL